MVRPHTIHLIGRNIGNRFHKRELRTILRKCDSAPNRKRERSKLRRYFNLHFFSATLEIELPRASRSLSMKLKHSTAKRHCHSIVRKNGLPASTVVVDPLRKLFPGRS